MADFEIAFQKISEIARLCRYYCFVNLEFEALKSNYEISVMAALKDIHHENKAGW